MIESRLGHEFLWYSVPDNDADALCVEVSDAFLIGLLPVAMSLGEDIELDGSVSSTLLFNLNHGLVQILKAQIPGFRIPHFSASTTEHLACRGTAVATGVSGGVDSSHIITTYHLSEDVPRSMRLSQLLFFNVGAHERRNPSEAVMLFKNRLDWVQRIAEAVDLPLLIVNSNLGDFYHPLGMNHESTSTARNVSAALAVQSRVMTYLVGTGPPWQRCFVGPTKTMELSDPFSLPLLHTERFQAFSVGGELTRAQKIAKIADQGFVQKFLRPCIRSGENCGRCYKCKNTQLGLEILGKLDRYAETFDRDLYAKERDAYIALIRTSGELWDAEFLRFAADHEFDLSVAWSLLLKARIRKLESNLPGWIRKMRLKVQRKAI